MVGQDYTSTKLLLAFECLWTNFEAACDGVTAVEQYKNSLKLGKTYDIIVISNRHPEKNGLEAVKELRNLGFQGCLICIASEFYWEDEIKYLDHGANKIVFSEIEESDVEELRQGVPKHHCARKYQLCHSV